MHSADARNRRYENVIPFLDSLLGFFSFLVSRLFLVPAGVQSGGLSTAGVVDVGRGIRKPSPFSSVPTPGSPMIHLSPGHLTNISEVVRIFLALGFRFIGVSSSLV